MANLTDDNLRAIVRADLGLVLLDDGVERSRLDVALFGEHRLERANAQFDLGQLRVVVIMMMFAHSGQNRRNRPSGRDVS